MRAELGRRCLLGGGLAALAAVPRRAWAHPDHVSFCEMHHRPAKKRLECSLRAKVEDLEHVVRISSALPLRFGGKGFDAWIVRYLRQAIVLRGPQGQRFAPLEWVGSEMEAPFVWLYFTLPTAGPGQREAAPALAKYLLGQSYMIGVTSDQINTVVLYRQGQKSTLHYRQDGPRFRMIPALKSGQTSSR